MNTRIDNRRRLYDLLRKYHRGIERVPVDPPSVGKYEMFTMQLSISFKEEGGYTLID